MNQDVFIRKTFLNHIILFLSFLKASTNGNFRLIALVIFSPLVFYLFGTFADNQLETMVDRYIT